MGASGSAVRVGADSLRQFVSDLFVHMGWKHSEGDIVADHLVVADQSGHPSHGIGMLGAYVDSFRAGAIRPGAEPADRPAAPPFAVIDANFALGHIVALEAVDRAVGMVGQYGVGIVNVIRAHHMGRIGHYAERAADAGMISMFWANVYGRAPLVAPFGGTQARIGTNPHCIGIPRAGQPPLLLDFATSRIPLGKARVAHTRGVPAPEGSLLDHLGKETRNPAVMFEEPAGALLPFGDHKGYGLALVAELLSSALAGGETIAELDDAGLIANNLLAIVLDPTRLGQDPESVSERIERYLRWVTDVPLAEGVDAVLAPGDPEFDSRRAHAGSVELSAGGLARLNAAAAAAGFRPFTA